MKSSTSTARLCLNTLYLITVIASVAGLVLTIRYGSVSLLDKDKKKMLGRHLQDDEVSSHGISTPNEGNEEEGMVEDNDFVGDADATQRSLRRSRSNGNGFFLCGEEGSPQRYCVTNRQKCVTDKDGKPACECLPGYQGGNCMQDIEECKIPRDADEYPCPAEGSFCVEWFAPIQFECGCLPGFTARLPVNWSDPDVPVNFRPEACVPADEPDISQRPTSAPSLERSVHPTATPLRDVSICSTQSDCVGEGVGYLHHNYRCDETIGRCVCKDGFVRLADNCQDQNECAKKENNNCHRFADCLNEFGSYSCKCYDGFEDVGDGPPGTNCAQIDECSRGTHNCPSDFICIDRVPVRDNDIVPVKFECVSAPPSPAPTAAPTCNNACQQLLLVCDFIRKGESTCYDTTKVVIRDTFIGGTLPRQLALLPRLTHLELWNVGLTGTIPTLIGQMSRLQYLDLDENDFTGEIPTEIGNLVELTELYISRSAPGEDPIGLAGVIPTEIGRLVLLKELRFNNNLLSGTVPTEIKNLVRLETLDFEYNALTSDIPTEICALTKLKEFDLEGNELDGSIPTEIGCLVELVQLDLEFNSLAGDIPTEICSLTKLTELDLEDNLLSNTIPSEIGCLVQLIILDLQYNTFSGGIPTEICSLVHLKELHLERNSYLDVSIPTEIGCLTELTLLHLYQNTIPGTIPTEVGRMVLLEELDLEQNSLTGLLPTEICSLKKLTLLDVEGNTLSQNIPTEVGCLTKLTKLDLEFNSFKGHIPTEVGMLVKLIVLDFGSNELAGPLPTIFGALTSLTDLYLRNNQFTGAVPIEFGSLTTLDLLYLNDNQLSGALPSELGNLSSLRYLRLYGNALVGTINIPNANFKSIRVDCNDITCESPLTCSDSSGNDC